MTEEITSIGSVVRRLEDRIDRGFDQIRADLRELATAQSAGIEVVRALEKDVLELKAALEAERGKRESDRLRVARLEEREKERSKGALVGGAGAGAGAFGLAELLRYLYDLFGGGHK